MTTRSGQWDLLPYEVPGKQAGVEADQMINPMPRPRAERSRQAGWLGGGGHPPGGDGMDAGATEGVMINGAGYRPEPAASGCPTSHRSKI